MPRRCRRSTTPSSPPPPSRRGTATCAPASIAPIAIRRVVLLVPGVHAMGIDEPRLTGLSNELAATGLGVVTMELPDLARYRFTPETVDVIEDGARVAERPARSDARRHGSG